MGHRTTTPDVSGADRGGRGAGPCAAEPRSAGAFARRRGAAGLAARLACIGVALAGGAAAQAQDGERFGGRLSIVPVDFATRPNVSGSGEAEAVLDARTLTVTGTFEGLSSPATAANLHRAPPARRGPAVFALDVTDAASGRVEGEVDLDDAQVEALRRGGYYVQIATRNNPDGEIRGWLLPRAETEAEPGSGAGPGADPEPEPGADAGGRAEPATDAGDGAEPATDAEARADAGEVAGAAGPEPARYLASQARTGEAAYRNVCASCHQADLSGGFDTPELAGTAFRSLWGGRPVRELLGYVEAAMPPAGRRPDEDTLAAIVAYILQQNGAGAGDAPLSAASGGMIGP